MEVKHILSIWKDRITKETKRGDKIRACRNAGTVFTTFQNALLKESLNDLTDFERRSLEEMIKILDERKEAIQKIQEQYAK